MSQFPLSPGHRDIREFFRSDWSYDADDLLGLGEWTLIADSLPPSEPFGTSSVSDFYLWRETSQRDSVLMGALWGGKIVVSESGGRYNLTDVDNTIDAWQPLPLNLETLRGQPNE